jgi:hypothetical protein
VIEALMNLEAYKLNENGLKIFFFCFQIRLEKDFRVLESLGSLLAHGPI